MKRLFHSTIAWLVAAIFLLQLLSSGAALYLLRTQIQGVVHADRTRQVLDVRDVLMAVYYEGGRGELEEFILQRRGETADPLMFAALTGGSGDQILANVAQAPELAPAQRPSPVHVTLAHGKKVSEGLAIATALADGSQLIVGASTEPERGFDIAFAEAIGLTLALTVILALLSAVGLGLVISRRTHGIAKTAEALAAGDFAARVPHEDTGDGFDHLRQQVNLMAERIGSLVGQLQSVSGALAHDLQSPVARLRASIDTALARIDDPDASEALQMARSDAETLQAMLATALELGRLESGAVGDRRTMLDLGEVVADMVELYEPLAEQSAIGLSVEAAPVQALADRELISRALANLIDNALKYGGDRIVVACRTDGAWAELSVSDNGPGIAAEERSRAVDRFTRLDNARTRPGAGLGLAMASAVAQLHGGRLELSGGDLPDARGLVATIRLPRD